MNAAIKMRELQDAFDWASFSRPFENRAVVSRETGKIYCLSDMVDMEEEELPDDIDDGTRYVDLPPKSALELGRHLALRFIEENLPESFDLVDGYFARSGAYSKFKDLLDRKGKLDAWYQYEQVETERALREWADQVGLLIAPDSEDASA